MSENSGVRGITALVTGGSGFVGQRLVEMLIERGASEVISFDIAPKPNDAINDERIRYVQADITNASEVIGAMKGVNCVWHMAALVGPFHSKDKYFEVNYKGTLNVLEACRINGVKKMIFSSSPSTRFDGKDIDGLSEDQLTFPKKFLQLYAETKAMAEQEVMKSCHFGEIMVIAIAPHQVYGPRDSLFLPNLLTVAGQGRLRIFGSGRNKVSMTFVDNYCHALIIGYDSLRPDSPCLGKFYIVTDGGYKYFWKILDEAVVEMGFTSLWLKFKLPYFLLMFLAYICNFLGFILNTKLRLNPFNVKMLTIHRWFNIEAARRDLKYEPLYTFDEGWAKTLKYFREVWLPNSQSEKTFPRGKKD